MGRPTNADIAARDAKKAADAGLPQESMNEKPKGTEAGTTAAGKPQVPVDNEAGVNKVAEGNDEEAKLLAQPVKFKGEKAKSLDDYMAEKSVMKLDQMVVLVAVTYPGAQERVIDLPHSGVRVKSGPIGCLWSDGSTE